MRRKTINPVFRADRNDIAIEILLLKPLQQGSINLYKDMFPGRFSARVPYCKGTGNPRLLFQ